jgi:hypothetical protein
VEPVRLGAVDRLMLGIEAGHQVVQAGTRPRQRHGTGDDHGVVVHSQAGIDFLPLLD